MHTPKAEEGDLETLELADWGARTPAAFDALISMLAGYGTVWKKLAWYGPLGDPLFLAMPEHRYNAEVSEPWMLRLVNVEKALSSRGYPLGLGAELLLNVEDPTLPSNSGVYRLRIVGGRGTVERVSEPPTDAALNAQVGGLAALFSGHASAEHLALLGKLGGDPATLQQATQIFASPMPNLLEFF